MVELLATVTEARHGGRSHRWMVGFVPVAFFLSVAWVRCYLETAVFSEPPFFGYYIGLHHTLWMLSVMLTILLLAHGILRAPVARLLWIMYGGVLMFIPVGVAAASGRPLDMVYLQGDAGDILLHTATFCLVYEPNLPLAFELIAIFVGMVVLGRLYGRGWARSLGLAVAVQVGGSLLAVEWLKVKPDGPGVLLAPTGMANHPLYAVVYLQLAAVLTMVLLHRQGVRFLSRRALLLAAAAWVAASLALGLSGWLPRPFDAAAVGLLAGWFVLTAHAWHVLPPAGRGLSGPHLCMGGVYLLQLLVLLPIGMHIDRQLSPFGP